MVRDLANIRREYEGTPIDEKHLDADPLEMFSKWFNDALCADLLEPTAMMLSTVDEDRTPNCRVVLLKHYDENGFVFYTNYNSSKGREMANCSDVALTFYWDRFNRQIRVKGKVSRVESELSDRYFEQRPVGSRIAAVVSRQSERIGSREELEQEFSSFEHDDVIARPDNWGGYRVLPQYFEFWQGQRSRLHDRIIYELSEKDTWRIGRLAP